MTGDYYGEERQWGLGNTVFAIKIFYTLGLLECMSQKQKQDLFDFVLNFQHEDGSFYDELVQKKAFISDKLISFKKKDFNNFFHRETIRAETRQTISALHLLNLNFQASYRNFSQTTNEVKNYLSKLDWTNPWSAGSHFSHLLFFLHYSQLPNKSKLIQDAIDWIETIHEEDGAWYTGTPSLQQKINGAMKVITGLTAARHIHFSKPDKLIDLCLGAINDEHACDNFNIIYVLKYCNEILHNAYRYDEIKEFAEKRLKIYQKFYFSKIGGFSFFMHKSSVYYYGARITKGLNEPDMHGTVLFLWGLSIIVQLLGYEKKIGLKEFIT